MSRRPKLATVLLIVVSLLLYGAVTRGEETETVPPGNSEAGDLLGKMLDSTRVERLWIAGRHVDWKTGQPDAGSAQAGGPHTHCSAFVAAVAYRLGIYILRPPEHPQRQLADAQVDWLWTKGTEYGWQWVESGKRAQELANGGFLVVAAYKTHDPIRPGHIAIVKPGKESDGALLAEGPQIVQAGAKNYRSASLKEGFQHHPGALARQEIVFFAHPVSLDRLKAYSWKSLR